MDALPPETLPAVPHVTFLIFNLAIPNIIMWGIAIVSFFIAAWFRLPTVFSSLGNKK
jgi:hypothetical protein